MMSHILGVSFYVDWVYLAFSETEIFFFLVFLAEEPALKMSHLLLCHLNIQNMHRECEDWGLPVCYRWIMMSCVLYFSTMIF